MRIAVSLSIFGLLAGNAQAQVVSPFQIPEESYDFLSVTDGPCLPKAGIGIDPKFEVACKEITDPKRYRGRWFVAFETSFFTPIGHQSCIETKLYTRCIELAGTALPWPPRDECPRTQEFELEFIGRRNVLPRHLEGSAYEIVVDKLISAKRLPDPYDDECDPELHPELKKN
jgi:hypothetical protein